MKDIIHALHAELLKSKRTLAFWLTLIAPAVVISLQVAMMWDQYGYHLEQSKLFGSAWVFYTQQTLVIWSLLMLPLFVTLETALVAQWEHHSQQWKHLFALPVARGALYAAKYLCSVALIGLSCALMIALILLTGLVFRWVFPGLGFEAAPPLGEMALYGLLMFLGSWLIIAIQTWVAQRWSSFAVASGVGIALTVASVIVIQSKYAGFYPYTLPALVANGFSKNIGALKTFAEGVLPVKELLFGSIGGLVAAALGGWHFVRRDVL
ncbi:MAG TPA: ABC transporter permease [Anaerolineae bacterium]|nr:ABC transporter permease [Anaerolineae bacterium]HQI83501.1 ABC transporter permease [Anaerolineae bacterium]